MVNSNIQFPVKLLGQGLRNKPSGNYESGEYKTLTNVELIDGVLRTRRSFNRAGTTEVSTPIGFIGTEGDGVVVVGTTEQRLITTTSDTTLWSPASLPAPAGTTHVIVAYFRYNNKSYWITDSCAASTSVHTYYLYEGSTIDATFASLIQTMLFSEANAVFRDFFIFKDRLFLITSTGVRFSKATDPKVFSVPDGGFFKVPDQIINAAAAIRDTVYVGTSKGIYVFTYSIDPNADSYLRQIMEGTDIGSVCVHGDRVFASSAYSMVQVVNQSVDKVMDYEDIVEPDTLNTDVKIVSFQDSLLIIRRSVPAVGNQQYGVSGTYAVSNLYGDNRVLMINTDSQSVAKVTYGDCLDLTPELRGGIVDAIIPPTQASPRLFALTARNSSGTVKSRTYYMEYGRNGLDNLDGVDEAYDSTGGINRYKVAQEIEFDSLTPDGNEYMMKKFRSLMGMALLPTTDFNFSPVYEGNIGIRTIPLSSPVGTRPPSPFRIGLNQRGRSITLNFRSSNPTVPMLSDATHLLELSDLRMLWTYTDRAIATKTSSV